MSKAFKKDDDGSDDGDSTGADSLPGTITLPAGTKNYITPAGATKLQAELKNFLEIERPKLVETVAWAASNGDRSENADYIYGKRRLREIDRRIRFLSKRLEIAEIVDPSHQKSEQVLFGATITVLHEDGKKKKYSIVGVDEIDAARGKVSWLSPIAKALLGTKAGDVLLFRSPRGEEELEVIAVEYLPIL